MEQKLLQRSNKHVIHFVRHKSNNIFVRDKQKCFNNTIHIIIRYFSHICTKKYLNFKRYAFM